METVINRNELVQWLNNWIESQEYQGNQVQAKELEFVRDTLLDPNWSLLKTIS